MKSVLILTIIFFNTTSFAKEIAVKANSMVCSVCAQGITKKFKKLPEVESVNVNLDTKIVLIKTKGDLDLSDDLINDTMTKAGSHVTSIERK